MSNDWDDDMDIEFIPEDWLEGMNEQEELCLILTLFAKCFDNDLDLDRVYQAIYTVEHENANGINVDNIYQLVDLIKSMKTPGKSH